MNSPFKSYDKKGDLRIKNIGIPIQEPYEESLNEDIDELTQAFSGLNVLSKREKIAIDVLSSLYLNYPASEPDETNEANLSQLVSEEQAASIPVTNNTDTKSLLKNLLICLTRLPLTVLSMIQEKSPTVLKSLKTQFINLLRLICIIILSLSQSVLGMAVLFLFVCALYQTKWGYATIRFCLAAFIYLYKSFPANLGIDWAIEQLKNYALAWLALIMHGPVAQFVSWATNILSSISTSTETIVQAAKTTQIAAETAIAVSNSVQMNIPNQLIMALNSPEGRLAIKQALESSAILGGLALAWENQEIFYDQQLLPELNRIGNVITSSTNSIEDVKLITQDMSEDVKGIKQLVIQDLNTINKLIQTIENNKDLSSNEFKEILKLVQQNLQTTDLGRLINANGLTPDTIVGFLSATQQNLARLMGKKQLLLTNEGGTLKKRRNTTLKKNKRSSKKSKKGNKKSKRKYYRSYR
jgi:hypothetical protein